MSWREFYSFSMLTTFIKHDQPLLHHLFTQLSSISGRYQPWSEVISHDMINHYHTWSTMIHHHYQPSSSIAYHDQPWIKMRLSSYQPPTSLRISRYTIPVVLGDFRRSCLAKRFFGTKWWVAIPNVETIIGDKRWLIVNGSWWLMVVKMTINHH